MNVGSYYNELYLYEEAYNYGSKSGAASVGDVSIGNITLTKNVGTTAHGGPIHGGENYLYVEQYAEAYHGNATVGNVSLGNISMNANAVTLQAGGYNDVYVENEAYASHGIATAGTITIGNITANTGVKGEAYVEVYAYADGASSADKTGLITVGNVAMNAGSSGDMYLYVYDYAYKSGTAGGISIGNVSMHETKVNGEGELYLYETGHMTGKISVGNVAITDHDLEMYIYNDATGAGAVAGGITVGNISLTVLGAAVTDDNYIYEYAKAAGGNTQGITTGNIDLTAHHNQELNLYVSNSADNKPGAVNIGNVTVAVAGTNAATKADVTLKVFTDSLTADKVGSGSITTGNITIGSSGDTTAATKANMAVHVDLTSDYGNVTVGNITVSGGALNHAKTAPLDNFNVLTSWLDASAANGKVTVGSIDYSGYVGDGAYDTVASTTNTNGTLINVSGYLGAASIVGAQGGSTIIDNSGTNAIDLTHSGTNSNLVALQEVQNAVSDSGTAITVTSQSALDSINGWSSADGIALASGSTIEGLTGTTVVNGGGQSFANFLVNAENAIDVNGDAAYAGTVSGDTYLALNHGGHVVEIVELVGVQTFNVAVNADHYVT